MIARDEPHQLPRTVALGRADRSGCKEVDVRCCDGEVSFQERLEMPELGLSMPRCHDLGVSFWRFGAHNLVMTEP